jgi:hypothetical protein
MASASPWGLPLIACAAFPQESAVLAFMAAIWVGNALVGVGLFTLPARIVPEVLLGACSACSSAGPARRAGGAAAG